MQLPIFFTRPRPWWVLVLWAGVVMFFGLTLSEALLWTNWVSGFISAAIFTPFEIPFLLGIFFAPWWLLLEGLWRWRRWSRAPFFTLALSPLLLLSLWSIGYAAWVRAHPIERFSDIYQVVLPSDAKNFCAYFSGGGLSDHNVYFAFDTSPAETQRLISAHSLKPLFFYEAGNLKKAAAILQQLGYPGSHDWSDIKIYRKQDVQDMNSWTYEVMTDETMSKVIIKAITH
jgi:hypothetical protein